MSYERITDLPDEALLALYAGGDQLAARRLMLRLTPGVLNYAARVLGDRAEAEDVAQEAMLRLWKIAPDWQPGKAKVTTWLYQVVSNLCTDRLRKRRGVALETVAEPTDEALSVVENMLQDQRVAALDQALATLPERQRQAVVLRHLRGATNPEIAQILQISIAAVESLTARGKRALAAALAAKRAELGFHDD